MGSDLIAFVEFVAKGQEKVIDAGRHIESQLKTIVSGKSSEIKFTASGVENVDKAARAINEKLTQLARGGDLTRTVSSAIEEAFTSAGKGVGESFAGSLGSAFGSVAGGLIGGFATGVLIHAVGNALSELEHGLQMGEKAKSKRELVLAGTTSPEEREHYEAIYDREKTRFLASRNDFGDYAAGLRRFQDLNIEPGEAEKALNRLMVLAEGTDKGMGGVAEQYANMLARHDPRSRMAVVRSNPAIVEALREMFPQFANGDAEQMLMPAITKGQIGTLDVVEAVRRAALNPRVVQRADEERNTTGPRWSEENERKWERMEPELWAHPFKETWRELEEVVAGREAFFGIGGWRAPESVTAAPGMEGLGTGPWSAHPELTNAGRSSQFTSLAGLAEAMQTAANGDDVGERQLAVLQTIANNTASRDGSPHPGTPRPVHAQE